MPDLKLLVEKKFLTLQNKNSDVDFEDNESHKLQLRELKKQCGMPADREDDWTEGIDEDMIATQSQTSFICPITQLEMKKPVKDEVCGHTYGEGAIVHMTESKRERKKARCPQMSCSHTHMLDLLPHKTPEKGNREPQPEEQAPPACSQDVSSLPPPQPPESIIQRDESPMEKGLSGLRGRDFELSDAFYFSKKGLEAIVEDEVTQRFSSEELVSWNLLTRTNINFQYISPKLTLVWVLGVLIRYCFLLPLRVTLAFIGISLLIIGTTLVGQLPDSSIKNCLSELVHLTCCRVCVRSLSGTIHYHNKQYRPQKGGICVANHTSPIDVLILTTDGCYAMVGQVHGGLMGIIQRAMVKACPHVWFERSEMKDRHLVTKRLREHVADKKKLPILIFPEGTCINNTSVMMFKKGSFEIGGTIYPVAIKYNPQFGDAFWNSSKYGMVSYLLRIMTSWAIVCDVWYMPPMTREEGEDAVQFANRVKSAIAVQGGLTELPWDGGLKRAKVKDTFKEEQQKNYSKMIVGNGSPNLELD